MTDYKTLYFRLFNQVSDLIEAFQKAQHEAEERFLQMEEQNRKTDETE